MLSNWDQIGAFCGSKLFAMVIGRRQKSLLHVVRKEKNDLAMNVPDKSKDENNWLGNKGLFELLACVFVFMCVIGGDCVIPVFKAPFPMVSYVCQ